MNGSLEMHPSRRHSGLIDSKMPYSRWRVSRNDSLLQESGTLGAIQVPRYQRGGGG